MHEHPDYQYPGSGYVHETGRDAGEGYTLNVPLRPNEGHEQAMAGFEEKILPKLDAYSPQFLLISAGFDADVDDPLGHLKFTAETYRWMTQQLMQIAARHCEGRLVSLLEGGYDLEALGRDVSTHIATLLDG
jgi:acetoin utilization deacetylase AcuC-like enzyme